LITFALTQTSSFAIDNVLHTITLEKNNTGYNVILSADKMAKVIKKTPSNNELTLEISGITSSDTVNALYKGANNIDSLIIENSAPNKLKIFVKAENIKNSSVMMEAKNGEPTIVGETIRTDKVLWGIFMLALLAGIFKIIKDITEEDEKVLIKKDIKDREIQLYRRYRRDLTDYTAIEAQADMRMKKMLKKIDRKIDERLTSAIK
jgi:hypothetical protein